MLVEERPDCAARIKVHVRLANQGRRSRGHRSVTHPRVARARDRHQLDTRSFFAARPYEVLNIRVGCHRAIARIGDAVKLHRHLRHRVPTGSELDTRNPGSTTTVDRMIGVGQSVNVQDRYRLHRPAVIDPEAARLHADRHDSIRQFAGEPVRHDRPIRVSRRENTARVDLEPLRQEIQQEEYECHVVDVSISGRTAAVSAIPCL